MPSVPPAAITPAAKRPKQRAGKHIGNAQTTGDAVHKGVHGRIEILTGARAADCSPFQDKQRNGQQGDRRHFLVDILCDGIEGGMRHEDRHKHHRYRAQRESNRHARKHHSQRGTAIEQPDHACCHDCSLLWLMPITTCRIIWMVSRIMPMVIKP